jgi:hypothetical protein
MYAFGMAVADGKPNCSVVERTLLMVNGPIRQMLVLVAALALEIASPATAAWGQTAEPPGAGAAASNPGVSSPLQQQSLLAQPVTRDAAGNLAAVDGVIQGGEDQSGFSNAGVGGVFDVVTGVGALGAGHAFGGDVAVVTPTGRDVAGDNSNETNTSDETNTDEASASTTLAGGVNNAQ